MLLQWLWDPVPLRQYVELPWTFSPVTSQMPRPTMTR
jgi:hypothetical protein